MEAAAKAAEQEADESRVDEQKVDATKGPLSLVTKLAQAMAAAAEVTKSATNTEQNYKYASAEAILEATRGPLLERGVVLIQRPQGYEVQEITSSRGTKGTLLTVAIDFTFIDGESGEDFTIAGWQGQGQDYGDKAYGKAYTNAVKTFIRAQWLLPTGDDPEASDPGERVANNGRGQLPGWAAPATEARKKQFLDALAPVIGRPRAKALAVATVDTIDAFPDLLVGFTKGLVAHIAAYNPEAEAASAAAEAPDPPAPDDARATRDASPEPAEASPEPELAPEPEPEPEDLTPADAPGLAPGTVEPPDTSQLGKAATERVLREAGCICKDPSKDDGRDDACPLKNHGIPF